MTQNNHTDNKPCIVCKPPPANEREATDERIDAHGGVLEYLSNHAVFDAELTPDRTRLFLVDGCDAVFAVWLQKQHVARLIAELQALHDQMPGKEGKPDIAKQNAALRECVTYARSKRGKDFDFDTWEAMCAAAMAGEHAPSALENEIALHAQTRDALIAVRKERDALLDTKDDDLEYAQDAAVFELDNTGP